ncbi:MAG: hypothetical protein ABSA52_14405 [Candidatus Binatia bacterium]|jgi:hypothetical protein
MRRRLTSISTHLGRDELAVLVLVSERLRVGRRRYGELRLDTDTRDFRREALEEAADLAVYAAAALIAPDKTALPQRAARDEGGSSVLNTAARPRTRRSCPA